MASQVLRGWSQTSGEAQQPHPRAATAGSRPSRGSADRLRKHPLRKLSPKHAAESCKSLERRIEALELGAADLGKWRESLKATLPESSVCPCPPLPSDGVPTIPSEITSSPEAGCAPYVVSSYGRVHKVTTGYPEHTRFWTTHCGWRFATSPVAKPLWDLPEFYKLLCEKCLGPEREAARCGAEHKVLEDGGTAQSKLSSAQRAV